MVPIKSAWSDNNNRLKPNPPQLHRRLLLAQERPEQVNKLLLIANPYSTTRRVKLKSEISIYIRSLYASHRAGISLHMRVIGEGPKLLIYRFALKIDQNM